MLALVVGLASYGMFVVKIGIPCNFEYLKEQSDIYILSGKLDQLEKGRKIDSKRMERIEVMLKEVLHK